MSATPKIWKETKIYGRIAKCNKVDLDLTKDLIRIRYTDAELKVMVDEGSLTEQEAVTQKADGDVCELIEDRSADIVEVVTDLNRFLIVSQVVDSHAHTRIVEEEAVTSHWDIHPDYPVEDWKYEIANDDTRQSYKEWVESKIEAANEA